MKKRIVQVPMDAQLLSQLDELSEVAGTPRAAIIREACAKYVMSKRTAELERQYIEGYRQFPESPGMGEAGVILAVETWGAEDWSDAEG